MIPISRPDKRTALFFTLLQIQLKHIQSPGKRFWAESSDLSTYRPVQWTNSGKGMTPSSFTCHPEYLFFAVPLAPENPTLSGRQIMLLESDISDLRFPGWAAPALDWYFLHELKTSSDRGRILFTERLLRAGDDRYLCFRLDPARSVRLKSFSSSQMTLLPPDRILQNVSVLDFTSIHLNSRQHDTPLHRVSSFARTWNGHLTYTYISILIM